MNKLKHLFYLALLFAPLKASPIEVKTVEQLRNAPAGVVCEIKGNLDLSGKSVALQQNQILDFTNGILKNGCLIGNNTQVKGGKKCFDHIEIKGTWNVFQISTDFFVDLSYDNAICNVFALGNGNKQKTITINEGTYYVTVDKSPGIVIGNDTKVLLNGNIQMRPNDKTAYRIVSINGTNVSIVGTGHLIGDRSKHTGTTGEWGMGIMIYSSRNVSISGITIEECWGDCIYVSDKSTDVSISNCILQNSRRQGISITSAGQVTIKDCTIRNIGGTSPGLAIDVEPNKEKSVEYVLVENVVVTNCEAGFSASNRAEGSSIERVKITNSKFYGTKKNYCIYINGAKKANVAHCYIDSGAECGLWFSKVLSGTATNNTFVTTNKKTINKYLCMAIKERRNTTKKLQ